jgi:hypothetical protein
VTLKIFIQVSFLIFFMREALASSRPMLLSDDSVTTCFPANNLRYSKNFKSSGLTLFDLLNIIKQFEEKMGPRIDKEFGKKILINYDWDNERVNAHATRDTANNAVIVINGGLVRHPMMTRDALTAIICHELGHQFGGAPKQKRGSSELRSWSSAEGQADYYATTQCLPHLFSEESENRRSSLFVDEKTYQHLSEICDDTFCQRATLAALQMTRVFASLRTGTPEPSLQTPDTYQVYETDLGHPNPQCRLDTMISGLYCEIARERKFDDKDPLFGACTNQPGGRPACWFHPDYF